MHACRYFSSRLASTPFISVSTFTFSFGRLNIGRRHPIQAIFTTFRLFRLAQTNIGLELA